ncbi:Rgi2 protein [Maudiozyma humilis]|uniref:Rgi2 protein n=1 Tax=Maudiozyma humilis TaxID=51915 RepID=A0AAV5RVT8_MAUHU|nr:Rgi2 protein [Kazachstania humilis]
MTNKKNKSKGPKSTVVTLKNGESVKVFEDMHDFETYLRNETEDNEFDHIHCKLQYYPPFVLRGAHDDLDRIKDTDNCHSRKYVRHLKQHVEKHLLRDIGGSLNHPELRFGNKSKQQSFDTVSWKYGDETELNCRKFKIDVEVACHNNGAMVDVDYKTGPVEEEQQEENADAII